MALRLRRLCCSDVAGICVANLRNNEINPLNFLNLYAQVFNRFYQTWVML